ncbi:hypothetical protein [Nocardia fluminea]|uniref:hypothetical protein n=1 Tax=Nocardia fluminea TaxID=134984 RepID=UPI003D09DEB2
MFGQKRIQHATVSVVAVGEVVMQCPYRGRYRSTVFDELVQARVKLGQPGAVVDDLRASAQPRAKQA